MPSLKNPAYDALIVGAGPAGSTLGHLLTKKGLRVAIIDKHRFPREKVCGGGLSRKSMRLLDGDISPIVHKTISGAFLTYQNKLTLVKDIVPAVGCTVLRSEFDQYLLDKACASGATFFPETTFQNALPLGTGVSVTTSRGNFSVRRLIAADGVASTVRAKVFGRELVHYVPAIEALVTPKEKELGRFGDRAVFDFGGMPKGYGWIFPKRDHLNVGIFSPFGGNSMRAHLDRFLERFAGLKQPISKRYLGYAIPVRNAAGIFQRGPVWLLGDAAGLAESVFGEGIYFAMKSAHLAAQAFDEEAFSSNSRRYTELLKLELLPELRASERIGKALFRFPEFAFTHLVLNDRINDDFAGLISGDVGYRRCFAKTALGPLKWLRPSQPVHRAGVL